MTFIIYFNIIPKKENIVCDILSPKKNSVSAQLNHYSQLTWKPRFTMYYMDAHIPSTQLFIPIPQRLYSFSSLRALSLHLHKSAHCLFSWYRTHNCKTLRLGKFDPCLTVSLVASIVFPQALFWYTYPIIIMISFWYSWLFHVLGSFLFWLQNLLASIPVINIIIRATVTRWHNLHEVEAIKWHQQPQKPGSEGGALDAIEFIVDSPATHESHPF